MMRRLATALLFISLVPVLGYSQAADKKSRIEPPPEFVGDGCTFFPDGDYADCCLAHDRDYYTGGTNAERKASDKRLQQCVRSKGHNFLSKMMYLGVRLGGGAWLRAPFSWGFGQRKNDK